MKVVRLSALRTGRLTPPPPQEIFLVLISVKSESTPGPKYARKIMSMTNSNDTLENRTRDLQVCSAVPQLTAPPRAPHSDHVHVFKKCFFLRKERRRRWLVFWEITVCWSAVRQRRFRGAYHRLRLEGCLANVTHYQYKWRHLQKTSTYLNNNMRI
jgi:hypothetical protein